MDAFLFDIKAFEKAEPLILTLMCVHVPPARAVYTRKPGAGAKSIFVASESYTLGFGVLITLATTLNS